MAGFLRSRAKTFAGGALLHPAQLAGGLLPRAPAAGGLLPRAPAAGALLPRAPASGGLLQPRLFSNDAGKGYISVLKTEFESMAKAVEGKDVEMMIFECDMRRMSLYTSWSEVGVVGTRSRPVDFTSLPKALESIKVAIIPGSVDIRFVYPFCGYVGMFIIMALLFPVNKPAVISEKMEKIWTDVFFVKFFKYFPTQDEAKPEAKPESV